MMWQFNRWHEEDVIFWNEELPDIENGYSIIEKEDSVTIRCFVVDIGDRHIFDKMGRHVKEGIILQIAEPELYSKDFTLYENGRTHFELYGNTYRIQRRTDYSRYNIYQLIEVVGIRIV